MKHDIIIVLVKFIDHAVNDNFAPTPYYGIFRGLLVSEAHLSPSKIAFDERFFGRNLLLDT